MTRLQGRVTREFRNRKIVEDTDSPAGKSGLAPN